MFDPADERVFGNEDHPIRYLFREGRSDHLLVIFSGFDLANRQRYNYIRHLEGVGPHRMYVLDDLGPRGCYYLGANRDLFVARGVSAAVAGELDRLGLGADGLTMSGSSKGGSAAIYFGLQLGCRVLAGAPGYLIGDYVTNETAAVAVCRLIAGGSEPDDVGWLNGVIAEAITRAAPGARISLFSSPDDKQYAIHIQPMIERLRAHDVEHDLTLGDYSPHRVVFEQFAPWMREQVLALTGEAEDPDLAEALMDATCQRIIRDLRISGRMRMGQLSARLGLLPATVRTKLVRLQRARVVRLSMSRQWGLTERGVESARRLGC